jgi:arylsulfatase A-like enzyme
MALHDSPITRRAFTALAGAGALARGGADERPNILWITCEDIGPALGCYGDRYADTPNLDRLAAGGWRYNHAWSNAPVCAPARTTIITGVYPTATGSEDMRSLLPMPPFMRMYPQLLGELGYYTSNNSKEDFNLIKPGKVWDDSSTRAHWRNRGSGQPFFSIFNFTITHESQIRTRPHKFIHDPAKVRVPAYHPDTPEVRLDWAQYYDNITTMDGQAGELLRQLEGDGLAGSTIVFFYGDHGSGMPRSKRWPYNSGLQVPLLAYFPDKWRHLAPKAYRAGGASDRLVGFIDLAPTLLSLAGERPPDWMQGHAFAGRFEAPPQRYLYGFRGRMDERYDLCRSVTDGRYVYLRQYMPHKIYGQHIAYMFETPTTSVWKRLYDEGKLNDAQKKFWEEKPPEELYDLRTDPDEVKNLASDPAHRGVIETLRKAERDWVLRTRDTGFLPEDEIHSRSQGASPYEMGHDPAKYPLERILDTAERASLRDAAGTPKMIAALQDKDSAVRWWGALGLQMRGAAAVQEGGEALRKALEDPARAVRIAAAEALGRFGTKEDLPRCLETLIALAGPEAGSGYVRLQALNVIEALGDKASPIKPRLEQIQAVTKARGGEADRATGMEYVARALENVLKR